MASGEEKLPREVIVVNRKSGELLLFSNDKSTWFPTPNPSVQMMKEGRCGKD